MQLQGDAGDIVMPVSFKSLNQSSGGNSRSSSAKTQPARQPSSIRDTFSAGQSSVRASSASSQTSQASRTSQSARSAQSAQSAAAAPNFPTDDMTSSDFMQSLKAKLSASGDDPEQYLRARSMVDALSTGQLKVSDPTKGKAVNAWDPGQKGTKSTAATDIGKTDWVDFLNGHLKRSDDGTLSKGKNGSYVDKTTGSNAYFGKVADRYYYVTWPSESKA
ncbi:hypothetical protein ACI2J4_18380 [Agrobacterium tumefaciens]|uniref:hypothetical protein n=1 Tax=Agrobacterium tumefaciens TaxID=358 RepID=UPI00384CD05B